MTTIINARKINEFRDGKLAVIAFGTDDGLSHEVVVKFKGGRPTLDLTSESTQEFLATYAADEDTIFDEIDNIDAIAVAALPATVVLGSSNVITDSPAFGAANSGAQSGTGLGVGPAYSF